MVSRVTIESDVQCALNDSYRRYKLVETQQRPWGSEPCHREYFPECSGPDLRGPDCPFGPMLQDAYVVLRITPLRRSGWIWDHVSWSGATSLGSRVGTTSLGPPSREVSCDGARLVGRALYYERCLEPPGLSRRRVEGGSPYLGCCGTPPWSRSAEDDSSTYPPPPPQAPPALDPRGDVIPAPPCTCCGLSTATCYLLGSASNTTSSLPFDDPRFDTCLTSGFDLSDDGLPLAAAPVEARACASGTRARGAAPACDAASA